jgi:hypothetical protein
MHLSFLSLLYFVGGIVAVAVWPGPSTTTTSAAGEEIWVASQSDSQEPTTYKGTCIPSSYDI